MKKRFFFFILLLMTPFIIEAKEYCKLISGNINTIGSEIACGDEHFYIIEDMGDSIKMFAKYNLEAGYEYDKVILTEDRYNEIDTACSIYDNDDEFLECVLSQPEFEKYDDCYRSYNLENENGNIEYHFIMYNNIEVNELKQNSKAIGAHGDEHGNPTFPEYGVVYIHPDDLDDEYINNHIYEDDRFADYSMDGIGIHWFDDTNFLELLDYQKYLNNLGYEVKNVNTLSVAEIDGIVEKVTGNKIPFDEWYEDGWIEKQTNYADNRSYWILGNFGELLPENKYDWLYSTTYWTRTVGYNPNISDEMSSALMFFVDSLGNLCNVNACNIAIGAGIRPTVEISKSDIIYNIVPETDGNGAINVPPTAKEGEIITYKIEPNVGYELEEMIIVTDSGNEIIITKDDVICDEENTCTIKEEKFVMPEEDIVIKVKFINNPKTGVSSFIGIIMLLVIISGGTLLYILNGNKRYEL